MPNEINPNLCPFCGQVNGCMINQTQACWCSKVDISNKLLALLPSQLQNKACICLSCVNAYQQNPQRFSIENNCADR